MNYFIRLLGTLAFCVLLAVAPNNKAVAQPGLSVSFQTFYDELSPYGQWFNDPQYGYVWSPRAGGDFRPYYTGGRWVMTNYGNTWVSDYNWGWAPFHYGRWTYDEYYGWLWIPGDEWGPAWVSWRSGGGYYGWAPLGPNISINLSFGNNYYVPDYWWVFVPHRNIYSHGYNSYWRGPQHNTVIIHNTTIINNVYNNRYVSGPGRNDVERYTGHRVHVYNVQNASSPQRNRVSNNSLAVYRPEVHRAGNNNFRPTAVSRTARPLNTQQTARIDRADARRNIERDNNAGNRNEPSGRNENLRRPAMERSQPMERMERPSGNMNRSRDMATQPGRNVIRENISREPVREPQMERPLARRDEDLLRADQDRRNQQRTQRPQREWRRPEPQPQQPQRSFERPQQSPVQRTERPQMQRAERPQRSFERPQQMQRQQPGAERREARPEMGRRR